MTKANKSTPAAAEAPILTEEEILKMSDKDYMNPAQQAFFKAKLQALEKELLKNAGETTEHLRETVLVPDPADRASGIQRTSRRFRPAGRHHLPAYPCGRDIQGG